MKKNNKKILTKFGIGLGSVAIATGIAAPIAVAGEREESHSKEKNDAIKKSTKETKLKSAHSSNPNIQQLQMAAAESKITESNVESYFQTVLKKLQAQLILSVFGSNVDDDFHTLAHDIVATFVNRVRNFKPQVDLSKVANGKINLGKAVSYEEQKYAFIHDEAKRLHVEVSDISRYEPLLETCLSSSNVGDIDAYKNDINVLNANLRQRAKKYMYSDLDYHLKSLDLEYIKDTLPENSLLRRAMTSQGSDIASKINEAKRKLVLNYVEQNHSSVLSIKNDGSFLNTLEAFGGTYNSNTSSEIKNDEDLNFLFSRVGHKGCSYTLDQAPQQTIDRVMDEIAHWGAIPQDRVMPNYEDYDFFHLFFNENALTGGVNDNTHIWDHGEVIMGYKLNVRIIDIDATTDSHKTNVSFQLGISLMDANTSDITWSDLGGQQMKDLTNDPSGGAFSIAFDLNDDQIRSVSSHTYYPHPMIAIANSLSEDGLNYDWNQKNRDIANILSLYNPDPSEPDINHYHLDKYPIYINDPQLLDGIDRPYGDAKYDEIMLKAGALHANQHFALKVTNVNMDDTNRPYITAQWVIVDEKLENGRVKYIEVVDSILWYSDDSDVTFQKINILCFMSEITKGILYAGQQLLFIVGAFGVNYKLVVDIKGDDNNPQLSTSDLVNNVESLLITSASLSSLNAIITVAMGVMLANYIFQSILTFGALAPIIALGSLALGCMAVYTGLSLATMLTDVHDIKLIKSIEKYAQKIAISSKNAFAQIADGKTNYKDIIFDNNWILSDRISKITEVAEIVCKNFVNKDVFDGLLGLLTTINPNFSTTAQTMFGDFFSLSWDEFTKKYMKNNTNPFTDVVNTIEEYLSKPIKVLTKYIKAGKVAQLGTQVLTRFLSGNGFKAIPTFTKALQTAVQKVSSQATSQATTEASTTAAAPEFPGFFTFLSYCGMVTTIIEVVVECIQGLGAYDDSLEFKWFVDPPKKS